MENFIFFAVMIRKKFLIFSIFEPWDSYKEDLYKKIAQKQKKK